MNKKMRYMIAVVTCLLFLLTVAPAYALDVQEVEDLNSEYGLIYAVAPSFSEGLAWCAADSSLATPPKSGVKYGYLDTNGQVAIPFQFEHAGDFQEGLAYVVKDGKIAYIDKTGKIVISTDIQPDVLEELESIEFGPWERYFQFQNGRSLYYTADGK